FTHSKKCLPHPALRQRSSAVAAPCERKNKPWQTVGGCIFIVHDSSCRIRRYRPKTNSGIMLNEIPPMIVMLPIHFQPDGPNGSSPTPYPSEAMAPRMKNGPVK